MIKAIIRGWQLGMAISACIYGIFYLALFIAEAQVTAPQPDKQGLALEAAYNAKKTSATALAWGQYCLAKGLKPDFALGCKAVAAVPASPALPAPAPTTRMVKR